MVNYGIQIFNFFRMENEFYDSGAVCDDIKGGGFANEVERGRRGDGGTAGT